MEVDAPVATKKPARAKSDAVHASTDAKTEERLDSAELWLAGGDPYLARLSLKGIDQASLSESGEQRAIRLQIETDLALGLTEEAAASLATSGLAAGENARLRADLCEREKQYSCVAYELILASGTNPTSTQYSNRIWNALLQTTTGQSKLTMVNGNEPLQGWLDLMALVRSATSLENERSAFSDWQQRYPDHPAARKLPDALDYLEAADSGTPSTVTVLLPLSGQLANIGKAVRDGMVAAHIQEDSESAPTLHFLDSASQPLDQLYAQAIQGGSKMIVGPLVKNEVVAMAALNPEVPVVALNYLDTAPSRRDFYQLGLAIEDEGLGIGEALGRFGHDKVLFITSTAPWAARALSAIQQNWQGEISRINISNANDMTEAIGNALQATPSFRRKAELQAVLAMPLQFSGGVRHDLQAIVALTDPVQTSTLGPALNYHAVSGVAVFLGTQSLRNNGTVTALKGARASELPVMLADDPLNQELRSAWAGQDGEADISFYALGTDAYRVLRRLPVLADSNSTARTIWGSTGLLTLNADHHFRRTQLWSQVRNKRLVETPAIP